MSRSSERIADDVRRFLDAGNKIQHIPTGLSGERETGKKLSQQEVRRRLGKQTVCTK
jgi:hypothetical protein